VKGLTQNSDKSAASGGQERRGRVKPPDRRPDTRRHKSGEEVQGISSVKYEPDEADTLEQPQHQVVEVAEDSMQYTEDNTQYTEEDYGDYTTNKNYGVAVELDDSSKGIGFLNQHIQRIEVDGVFRFQCTICGKSHGQKPHAQNHIESKHFPELFTYNCSLCNLTFNGRNKFYVHNSKFHKK